MQTDKEKIEAVLAAAKEKHDSGKMSDAEYLLVREAFEKLLSEASGGDGESVDSASAAARHPAP